MYHEGSEKVWLMCSFVLVCAVALKLFMLCITFKTKKTCGKVSSFNNGNTVELNQSFISPEQKPHQICSFFSSIENIYLVGNPESCSRNNTDSVDIFFNGKSLNVV